MLPGGGGRFKLGRVNDAYSRGFETCYGTNRPVIPKELCSEECRTGIAFGSVPGSLRLRAKPVRDDSCWEVQGADAKTLDASSRQRLRVDSRNALRGINYAVPRRGRLLLSRSV